LGLAAPVTLEYDPASHAMHVSTLVALALVEYLPATHEVHVSESTVEKLPVGHVFTTTRVEE
jgi:hypothetical protein